MAMTCPSCGAENLEGVDQCANCGIDLRTADLPKPASRIEQTVMHLPLTALPFNPIHAVAPDATLEVAVQTLARQKVDVLEVADGGCLVGVLTVRDIVNRVGPDFAAKLASPVREFMTSDPQTLPPDAPITHAINTMELGGYRHVPVVQGGRTVGVVSADDVIQYLVKHGREQVATEGVTTSHGAQPDRRQGPEQPEFP